MREDDICPSCRRGTIIDLSKVHKKLVTSCFRCDFCYSTWLSSNESVDELLLNFKIEVKIDSEIFLKIYSLISSEGQYIHE